MFRRIATLAFEPRPSLRAARSRYLAATLCLLVSGCGRVPAATPNVMLQVQDGRCGYDLDDAAATPAEISEAARNWNGQREIAVIFVRGEAPSACIDAAATPWSAARFKRVWIVRSPPSKITAFPILPAQLE